MIRRAVQVVLWLLVSCLAVESYIRWRRGAQLLFKARQLVFRNADPVFHNILIPNATGRFISGEWDVPYRINSWGLRDREFSLAKPAGTLRVLAVGDSNLEGYGVRIEEAYVKRFEALLNEMGRRLTPPVAYEVINGGVSGYSPLLEYLFLSQKGLAFDPDVVMVVYSFSDLVDDFDREQTTVFDANGVPLAAPPHKRLRIHGSGPIERWLMRHSRAYLHFEHKLNSHFYKRRHPETARIKEIDLLTPFRGTPEVIAQLWASNRRYLGLMHELLRERGIPMILVSFPDAVEIDAEEWTEGRAHHGWAPGTVVEQPKVIPLMEAFAGERGIPFVNLYEDIKASRVRPLYFKLDGHFTAQGHGVFAEALFHRVAADGSPTAALFRPEGKLE